MSAPNRTFTIILEPEEGGDIQLIARPCLGALVKGTTGRRPLLTSKRPSTLFLKHWTTNWLQLGYLKLWKAGTCHQSKPPTPWQTKSEKYSKPVMKTDYPLQSKLPWWKSPPQSLRKWLDCRVYPEEMPFKCLSGTDGEWSGSVGAT